jgi:NAD(P) transhydrogenase subunit beta
VNLLLLAGAAACAASAAIGGRSLWMVGLLVLAAALGVMVVLPIGGADMPGVISLLTRSRGSRRRRRAWRWTTLR